MRDTEKLNILKGILKERGLLKEEGLDPRLDPKIDTEEAKNTPKQEPTPKASPTGMRNFTTGAVRHDASGKGRFDLIPPSALRRVARVYEYGANKMGANNWTLGMPFGALIDSATRHLNDWRYEQLMNMEPQEDHLAQAIWNIMAIMHFQDIGRAEELNDLWKVGKPTNADRN